MSIQRAVNYGAFVLGQTFQEVKDIWPNARALYNHAHLQEAAASLTHEEVANLWISLNSRVSRLFIFRDYFFETFPSDRPEETMGVRIHPLSDLDDQPSSLSSLFASESLCRVAKAVAALVLVLLTSPLWTLFFGGAYLFNFDTTFARGWNEGVETAFSFFADRLRIIPEEPADSHVTPQDILRIGNALVGYRHVSTEELAQANARQGIPDGCSLNISFCGDRSPFSTALFERLDEKVAAGENCDQLIQQYENALTGFISQSIQMDLGEQPWTPENIFGTLQHTRFMIVKTGALSASDTHAYGKLGRFPKEYVAPEGVTLLPRVQRGGLGIRERLLPQQFPEQQTRSFISYVASFYRRELLRYIRQDFVPAQFGGSLNRQLYQNLGAAQRAV